MDDPVTWMERVDPKVVDLWIGFYLAEQESERNSMSEELTPDQALKRLQGYV